MSNELLKFTDALKREVMEETGLKVVEIHDEKNSITTTGSATKSFFSVECVKPFAAYQTIEGPVDSFGVCFICEVEGELLSEGDDTADIHWANMEEIREMIDEHKFSEIDIPAVLMFLETDI